MKTLITYASKKGTTKKCAEKLKQGITGSVKILELGEAVREEVKDYDNIVMGSPVYAGSLDKKLKEFCEKNKDLLKKKRTFLFLSCMNDSQLQEYVKNNLPDEVTHHLSDVICCGGAFYFSKMNFFEKFIIKKIVNSESKDNKNLKKVDGKTDIEMFKEENVRRLIREINQN